MKILLRSCLAVLTLVAYAPWCVAEDAKPAPVETTDAAEENVEDTATVERARRNDLRAFFTAPPVIPHNPKKLRSRDCQICHVKVRHIGGRVSPKSPHAKLANCVQCHVSAEPAFGEVGQMIENDWQGLKAPEEGDRAHGAAPPTIPHRVFMRENCTACHNPKSPYETIRSPHPERVNCMQCHVPERALDFRHGRSVGDDE
jgi:nitrate reductase (cytochrome), electron transfer subunit